MGLDMYLYRKCDKTMSASEAIDLDRAWWNGAHYDADAGKCINEDMDPSLEEVAYWRKANQIFGWFDRYIENSPDEDDDGVENCQYYRIPRSAIEELLDVCNKVRDSINLIPGDVNNGYRFVHGSMEPIVEKGLVVEDPSIAQELLPTTEGFFFGSYSYDEYYVQDIDDTIRMLSSILAEYDDDEFIYNTSW